MPSGPNSDNNYSDFYKLIGNNVIGMQSATSGLLAFNIALSGYYSGGALGANANNFGYIWASVPTSDNKSRYGLGYKRSTGEYWGNAGFERHQSVPIHCVKAS